MEDDLNKNKKMEDNLNKKMKMEDNLIFFEKLEWQPQKKWKLT